MAIMGRAGEANSLQKKGLAPFAVKRGEAWVLQ